MCELIALFCRWLVRIILKGECASLLGGERNDAL
jgi:hypothetical protein